MPGAIGTSTSNPATIQTAVSTPSAQGIDSKGRNVDSVNIGSVSIDDRSKLLTKTLSSHHSTNNRVVTTLAEGATALGKGIKSIKNFPEEIGNKLQDAGKFMGKIPGEIRDKFKDAGEFMGKISGEIGDKLGDVKLGISGTVSEIKANVNKSILYAKLPRENREYIKTLEIIDGDLKTKQKGFERNSNESKALEAVRANLSRLRKYAEVPGEASEKLAKDLFEELKNLENFPGRAEYLNVIKNFPKSQSAGGFRARIQEGIENARNEIGNKLQDAGEFMGKIPGEIGNKLQDAGKFMGKISGEIRDKFKDAGKFIGEIPGKIGDKLGISGTVSEIKAKISHANKEAALPFYKLRLRGTLNSLGEMVRGHQEHLKSQGKDYTKLSGLRTTIAEFRNSIEEPGNLNQEKIDAIQRELDELKKDPELKGTGGKKGIADVIAENINAEINMALDVQNFGEPSNAPATSESAVEKPADETNSPEAPVAPPAPPAPPPPAPNAPVGQRDISEVHLRKTPPPSPKPVESEETGGLLERLKNSISVVDEPGDDQGTNGDDDWDTSPEPNNTP